VFRSVPQLVSAVALLIGVSLFALTIVRSGFDETIASASRLGLAFPVLLLPGACWHLLRTWGWSIAFPDDARPGFARLFRVRLAADAISFFTIRGVTGEPLKIMLLYDQVACAHCHRRHHTRAAGVRDRVARHRRSRLNDCGQAAGDAGNVGCAVHIALDGHGDRAGHPR
jgi:hypothetical protein